MNRPRQIAVTRPIAVMGVSGSGKTTVAVELARRLEAPFVDADDLHPRANIDKMSAGEALDDEDRWPWLAAVGAWLAEHDGGVTACSALKRVYRDRLREACPGLVFVHLHGDRAVIEQRQAARTDHFMPASLMDSQLATLEPLADDERGVVIDVDQDVDGVLQSVLEGLADYRPADR